MNKFRKFANSDSLEPLKFEDLTTADLITMLEQSYFLIDTMDRCLEEFEPKWYSSADIIADSSDYLRALDHFKIGYNSQTI